MNVLCIWDVPKNLQNYFHKHLPSDINMIYPTEMDEASYCQLAREHKVEMIIGWRPTETLLASSNALQLFQNPGAGVQHLTQLFSKFPHIKLANCHGNAYFTAQHAVALLLTLTNTVIPHHHFMSNGLWRNNLGTRENIPLRYRKLGILGLGHVGSMIAKFISGFDLEIVACKRSNIYKEYPHVSKVFGYEQLDEFFSYCDIVIVTLPLTDTTYELIGEKHFDFLGENGLIVNIGRGEIIQEEALYNALKNATIKGAALDVWWNEREPIEKDNKVYPFRLPFHQLDNLVMSPHRGASPMSDLVRWDPVIRNIIYLKAGLPLLNIVDIDHGY